MGALHFKSERLDSLDKANLVFEAHHNGEEILDIQMRGAKRVFDTACRALSFEHLAIIVAITGPGPAAGMVFFAQDLARFLEGNAILFNLFRCQGGEFRAEFADRRTLRLDKNALFFGPLASCHVQGAYANLDDLIHLPVWWSLFPTSRFDIDDHNLIELICQCFVLPICHLLNRDQRGPV